MTQKEVREFVIVRDKRTCQYCGKAKLYKQQLNVDHIVPESQGGAYTIENLVVACKQCNHRKGNRSVADYVKSRLIALEREQAALRKILGQT